jgi:hypothetical protein
LIVDLHLPQKQKKLLSKLPLKTSKKQLTAEQPTTLTNITVFNINKRKT